MKVEGTMELEDDGYTTCL